MAEMVLPDRMSRKPGDKEKQEKKERFETFINVLKQYLKHKGRVSRKDIAQCEEFDSMLKERDVDIAFKTKVKYLHQVRQALYNLNTNGITPEHDMSGIQYHTEGGNSPLYFSGSET